jgi:hypothetical protein
VAVEAGREITMPVTVDGLTNGTTYTFIVTANNASGSSSNSIASNAVTPGTASSSVPSQPTNVQVTVLGSRTCSVNFVAPVSNGGSPISRYTVKATAVGGSAADTVTAAAYFAPVTVSGLVDGKVYTFTVTASNATGVGLASAPSAAITVCTVPSAPRAVTASSADAGAISITFQPPFSDGGAAITQYTVIARNIIQEVVSTINTSTTSVLFPNLPEGTSYTFTVTATNAAGASLESGASNTAMPDSTPGLPRNVIATVSAVGAVNLTFDRPLSGGGYPITSYNISWSSGNLTIKPDILSTTITALVIGQTYTFTVKAVNSKGIGPGSNSNQIVIANLPSPPQNVSATVVGPTVRIDFAPSASDGGSPLTQFGVVRAGFFDQVFISASSRSIVLDTIPSGQAFAYNVFAYNAAGSSSAATTNTVTITEPLPVPSAPIPLLPRYSRSLKQVVVEFLVPRSSGGSAISQYRLWYTSGSFTSQTITVPQVQPVTFFNPPEDAQIYVQAQNRQGWGDIGVAAAMQINA